MDRNRTTAEIVPTFGRVPMKFNVVPDGTLELEWQLFKRVQFDEGPVPDRYREPIGLTVSAYAKGQYGIFYRTEVAKLMGATPAEIEDAAHYAKASAGWSTHISGLQLNFEQFKKEVVGACDHVRAQQAKGG